MLLIRDEPRAEELRAPMALLGTFLSLTLISFCFDCDLGTLNFAFEDTGNTFLELILYGLSLSSP